MELGMKNCCNDGIEREQNGKKSKVGLIVVPAWSSILDSCQSADIGIDTELSALLRYLKLSSIGFRRGDIKTLPKKFEKRDGIRIAHSINILCIF